MPRASVSLKLAEALATPGLPMPRWSVPMSNVLTTDALEEQVAVLEPDLPPI